MNLTLTWVDGNGDEVSHSFPAKHEVCGRCDGHGTHLTPSIGEHAYSAEEFAEAFPEDEDREEYFRRGGIYDVTCEECKGNNVVPVVDESQLNEEQKILFQQYQKHEAEMARMDAEDRQTRYYESGGMY